LSRCCYARVVTGETDDVFVCSQCQRSCETVALVDWRSDDGAVRWESVAESVEP
jgi:hypothetical protein